MKIQSSSIGLASSHSMTQTTSSMEQLQVWNENKGTSYSAQKSTSTTVSLSDSAVFASKMGMTDGAGGSAKLAFSSSQLFATHSESQTAKLHFSEKMTEAPRQVYSKPSSGSSPALAGDKTNAVGSVDDLDKVTDLRLKMLILAVQMLTGKPVKIMAMDGPAMQQPASEGVPTPSSDGISTIHDSIASVSESESTAFAASGTVRTSDGQNIQFDIAFTMQREYSASLSTSIRTGRALKDPLILDFAGPAAALSDTRFSFDLDADGKKDSVALPGGSGFLALDRNGNGSIDDGSELFGAQSGDGFADLAEFDSDSNGWIDENDPIFSKLRIWQPDADGKGTLKTLAEANIGAFYLGHADTAFSLKDSANVTQGVVRSTGIYLHENGGVGTVSQVDLSV